MDTIITMFDLSKIQTLQWVVDKANIGIIIALAFSFLFGSASIYFSKRLHTATEKQRVIEKQISDQKIAEANERAATAELKSKELEIQLAKLRLAVADRFIPKFVADHLVVELQKYKNKSAIIYCGDSSSHEPLQFSQRLSQMFQLGGWKVTIENQGNVRTPPPRGMIIGAIGEINKEIAEDVYNQFAQLGYLVSKTFKDTGQADIVIQVLAK